MYESPIKVELSDIISDAVKKTDEYIVECVQKVGVSVNKDELLEALEFDRGQYEKGWHDRDAEIVRCKDCVYATRNDWGRIVCVVNNEPTLFSKTEDYFCAWGRREDGKI